ncbi:MAG: hypothetical protein HKN80_11775, partial [Acidimicrobiia bacterium]|nr:hypothetical protein [Acidimicrobiia bacterium]
MRRRLLIGSALTVLMLAIWAWFGPLGAWRSIERVAFDPASAREALAAIRSEPVAEGAPTSLAGGESPAGFGTSTTSEAPPISSTTTTALTQP